MKKMFFAFKNLQKIKNRTFFIASVQFFHYTNRFFMTSVFIFRRDLRLQDNLGLIEAYEHSQNVIGCFFMTPEQLTDINKYKSENSIYFMYESLKELNKNMNNKLNFFYDEPINCLKHLINNNNVQNVFVNTNSIILYSFFNSQFFEWF